LPFSKNPKDPDTALADLSTACLNLRPQEGCDFGWSLKCKMMEKTGKRREERVMRFCFVRYEILMLDLDL